MNSCEQQLTYKDVICGIILRSTNHKPLNFPKASCISVSEWNTKETFQSPGRQSMLSLSMKAGYIKGRRRS